MIRKHLERLKTLVEEAELWVQKVSDTDDRVCVYVRVCVCMCVCVLHVSLFNSPAKAF